MHDSASIGSCTAEGLTLTFYRSALGPLHVIGAGNAQKQADTLRDLCKSQLVGRFLPDQGGASTNAESNWSETDRLCQRHKVVSKVSYSRHRGAVPAASALRSGVEVEGVPRPREAPASRPLYELGVDREAREFGQESGDRTQSSRGDFVASVAATSPIYRRDTGDFTLTLGKTTWKPTDVC